MEIVKKIRSLLQGNLGVMVISSGLWNLGGNMVWPFFSLYVLELGGNYVEMRARWALTEPYFVIYAKDSVGLSGAQ